MNEYSECNRCGVELTDSNMGTFYFSAHANQPWNNNEVGLVHEGGTHNSYCVDCTQTLRKAFSNLTNKLFTERYGLGAKTDDALLGYVERHKHEWESDY